MVTVQSHRMTREMQHQDRINVIVKLVLGDPKGISYLEVTRTALRAYPRSTFSLIPLDSSWTCYHSYSAPNL